MRCVGFSLQWLLLLWSTGTWAPWLQLAGSRAWAPWLQLAGSRAWTPWLQLAGSRAWAPWLQLAGSRAWAQWLWQMHFSCSEACEIFPDQGLNLCPLHWQVDSYPLYHWGSLKNEILKHLPWLSFQYSPLNKPCSIFFYLPFSSFRVTHSGCAYFLQLC